MRVFYALLLLLIVLFVFLLLDYGSVKTIDPQAGIRRPDVREPRELQPPSRRGSPEGQSRLAVGERFASLDDLIGDQQADGFIKTGYFGNSWPARVTEITHDIDGISFVREGGTRHEYTGFEGYRMKMVRLSGAGGRETIVVFRSERQR